MGQGGRKKKTHVGEVRVLYFCAIFCTKATPAVA